MSYAPFEWAESLNIGSVDFVSPNEIQVLLDVKAPDLLALNTGQPQPFPRINGYVLIPIDEGYLVGQIEWITVERSAFPKRQGMKDFGLVDLPFPLRKVSVNPLGTLHKKTKGKYVFQRGTTSLPSVGTSVLLPTEEQLKFIVESGEHHRVRIGTSPLAGDADIYIDPDRLFGRHLAVLGNTGSGKSCSVAGLIHWSLEAAQKKKEGNRLPNARFIILDPNGEYSHAFNISNLSIKAKVFKVDAENDNLNINNGEKPLKVPLWFWNSEEWFSFAQASAKMQRPLLIRALREIKAGGISYNKNLLEEKRQWLKRYLSTVRVWIKNDMNLDKITTAATNFGNKLEGFLENLENNNDDIIDVDLISLIEIVRSVLNNRKQQGRNFYSHFSEKEIVRIIEKIDNILYELGGIIYQEGPDENVPVAYDGSALADHLEMISLEENVSQFLDPLIMRIRMLLSNQRMKSIIDDSTVLLEKWLEDYIGNSSDNDTENNNVIIIDLSLVPSEIIYVTTAVIARMIFEALQRYMKLNHVCLPTVLVMEEAHTFIKRYKEDEENNNMAIICTQIFEKIAREGRKFGLSLVISSQRPSELSPTVLSQCNSFLLHRITNDRDQEIVSKLIPDNLRGLLRELPTLPTQMAILLGWVTELPILVKMRELPKEQRPQSDDPDFWNVWIGEDENSTKVERTIDWGSIVDEWQGGWGERRTSSCKNNKNDVIEEIAFEKDQSKSTTDDNSI